MHTFMICLHVSNIYIYTQKYIHRHIHTYVHVGVLCVYVPRQVHVSSKGMAAGGHRSAMLLLISVFQSRNPSVIDYSGHGWAMDSSLRLSTPFLKWTEEVAVLWVGKNSEWGLGEGSPGMGRNRATDLNSCLPGRPAGSLSLSSRTVH